MKELYKWFVDSSGVPCYTAYKVASETNKAVKIEIGEGQNKMVKKSDIWQLKNEEMYQDRLDRAAFINALIAALAGQLQIAERLVTSRKARMVELVEYLYKDDTVIEADRKGGRKWRFVK